MAQRAREIVYRETLGWVMQFMGTGDAIRLTHCPYCGGELPRLKWPNTDAAWRRLYAAIWGEEEPDPGPQSQADGEGDE